MARARRTWRSIKRQYARDYPHQVFLTNYGGWRNSHISHALRSLDYRAYRWWHEGGLGVWGFIQAGDAAAFESWASSSGIDWTVPPAEQTERPPAPLDLTLLR